MVAALHGGIGLFALLAKIYHIALLQAVTSVYIVVCTQLAFLHLEHFAYRGISVASPGYNVILAVAPPYLASLDASLHLLLFLVLMPPLATFTTRHVITVKAIFFNHIYQRLSIGGTCGISCPFQAMGPGTIIADVEVEKRSIAAVVTQKF